MTGFGPAPQADSLGIVHAREGTIDSQRARLFPLSSVLFPRGIMPLHIFEPRYLTMINEAIDDDATFGVVLIERGPEVGGGDSRFNVGTTARIVRAGVVDGERMAIVALGLARFDVVEWLDDDPYPMARIEARSEPSGAIDLEVPLQRALKAWRRVAAFASELGADVGSADLKLPEDPIDALWTLCSVSPLEQIDRQTLLEVDDPAQRLARLHAGLDEQAETLQARLAGDLD